MSVFTVKPRVQALLRSEETYATVLLLWALDSYGVELLQWHPATIRQVLEEDWEVSLPQLTFDKLLMAITLITTDLCYKNVDVFIDMCNVFSGTLLDFQEIDPADTAEILWGITEAELLDELDDSEKQLLGWSPEIVGYIESTLEEEGIVTPIDKLSIGLTKSSQQRLQQILQQYPEAREDLLNRQGEIKTSLLEELRQNLRDLVEQLNEVPLKSRANYSLAAIVENRLRQVSPEQPKDLLI